jgi:hypothetical protein
MNIFEQLSDIITKKQNKLADNVEDEGEFIPFMTQRWLSMYSPQFAEILNVSTNRMWKSLEDKQMWYKFYTAIIPKSGFKRIAYIKKESKAQKKINNEIVALLAERLELSQREIKSYIESGQINVNDMKKQFNM